MNREEWRKSLKEKAESHFNEVPDYIKYDLVESVLWARNTLTSKEGSGHDFQLTGEKGGLVCSFAKPEWSGDHSGSVRDTASEAIVDAVVSYLCGL